MVDYQCGDRLRLDAARSLTPSATPEGEEIPEVPVRLGLTARLGRNVYYRLVEEAEQRPGRPGWVELGLFSGETWQPLGSVPAEAL
ncbi:DUF1285 family C-terminal domain-containing protein [Halomonas sp. E19]|uniref:DUF1285 family C-terminal domain-containing protein n=1 Tax=Halomonas sp. E19 TaxID=3397247 RepID=UPI0040339C43